MATTNKPKFILIDENNVEHDYTEIVTKLNIVHETLDAEGSGRDVNTGLMQRTIVAEKHTLNVEVWTVDQTTAFYLNKYMSWRPSFSVKFELPCSNDLVTRTFYCSSINFGAQRWDRANNKIVYEGMNFKLVEV